MELVQVGNSFRLLVATLYNEALALAVEGYHAHVAYGLACLNFHLDN